jgi:C_GCAxxG_C_C family probable redox protein
MTAAECFRKGYSCAQAVVVAHAAEIGLTEEQAARAAAAFGGGFGGLRRTCGALAGLALLAGMKEGGFAPGDVPAKNRFYRQIQALEKEFAGVMGSSVCRDILRAANVQPSPEASERTKAYYALRPCERCVALADDLYRTRVAAPSSPS